VRVAPSSKACDASRAQHPQQKRQIGVFCFASRGANEAEAHVDAILVEGARRQRGVAEEALPALERHRALVPLCLGAERVDGEQRVAVGAQSAEDGAHVLLWHTLDLELAPRAEPRRLLVLVPLGIVLGGRLRLGVEVWLGLLLGGERGDLLLCRLAIEEVGEEGRDARGAAHRVHARVLALAAAHEQLDKLARAQPVRPLE